MNIHHEGKACSDRSECLFSMTLLPGIWQPWDPAFESLEYVRILNSGQLSVIKDLTARVELVHGPPGTHCMLLA